MSKLMMVTVRTLKTRLKDDAKPAELYKLTCDQISKVKIGDRFDDEQKEQFSQLMVKYPYLFGEELADLRRIEIDLMRIELDENILIKIRYTRIPLNQLDKLARRDSNTCSSWG